MVIVPKHVGTVLKQLSCASVGK